MKNNVLTKELAEYWTIIGGFAAWINAALKHFSHDIKGGFYTGLRKGQRRLFVLYNLFLSAYSVFVIYISHSEMLFASERKTYFVFFFSILLFLFVYNLIVFICSRYRSAVISATGKKSTLKKETVLLFGGACFFILLVSFVASFPGGISPDTENQWLQVHNGRFDDWHPVIHTLLIWLVTRIIDHYAFVCFVQITVFSIGVGLLIATLESWGFGRKHVLTAGLFIILNPYTMNIMMYLWKDSALTVLIVFIAIMMINIYFSQGAWFSKWRNAMLFALAVGLASIVRHNGFFFTLPLSVLVLFLYSRQTIKAPAAVVLTMAFVFLVKVPLYSALNVTYPHNFYQESVGIPMTILGDALIKKSHALPPKAKEFLNTLATDEEWRKNYVPGNYNSIKFTFNASDRIKAVPPRIFLKWVLQTYTNAKRESFSAVCNVTDIVWKIERGGSGFITPPPAYANNIISRALHIGFIGYFVFCLMIPVISWLFTNTGLLMLLLLLGGIFSLRRNGANALFLLVPSVCYNLGTMLLLCGPDVRFFHFNVVITLPLLFVLLAERNE
ncbi:MAG: hypothetical protein LBF93_07700 [Zoogloeaceae bacterium]|jgi:hypothetical protein|nr:hypothetical protein [Zoogloeaceae bacterium]